VNIQIVVIAKEPLPGRVKTRLCPPCTPEQAAGIAGAALADTLDTVSAAAAVRRVLLLEGRYPTNDGWEVVAQRGNGLGPRLSHGFADTAQEGVATLLIGMDTPQVSTAMLAEMGDQLSKADAVLGPAEDGGWWGLALRRSSDAKALAGVPMSRHDTGARTAAALRAQGLSVATAPSLRDVDTVADLAEVAALCSPGRFASAVAELRLA
jgi:rSAM/selenodomain-associated transferase 1